MASVNEVLTPRQRLALSRQAMVRQLNGGRDPEVEEFEAVAVGAQPAAPASGLRSSGPGPALARGFPWGSVARSVAQRWWQRHPVNAVGQLARPLLNRYAQDQPVKLMAVAATTGAVMVVLRPWRLLSATALAALLFKSSDVADVIDQLMRKPYSSNDVHP